MDDLNDIIQGMSRMTINNVVIPPSPQILYNTNNRNEILKQLLTYFTNSFGNLNRLYKYIHPNLRLNVCSTSSIRNTNLCSLCSQCGSTSELMNYFFGNPTINGDGRQVFFRYDPQGYTNIKNGIQINNYFETHMEIHDVGNLIINAGSTNDGFPGHVFNIIMVKNGNTIYYFLVQSYIFNYTFQFEEISRDRFIQIIDLYYSIFFTNRNKRFSNRDNTNWINLTGCQLRDYKESSLIGTSKPNFFEIFGKIIQAPYLIRHTRLKYKHIIERVLEKMNVIGNIIKYKKQGSLWKQRRKEVEQFQKSFGNIQKLKDWIEILEIEKNKNNINQG